MRSSPTRASRPSDTRAASGKAPDHRHPACRRYFATAASRTALPHPPAPIPRLSARAGAAAAAVPELTADRKLPVPLPVPARPPLPPAPPEPSWSASSARCEFTTLRTSSRSRPQLGETRRKSPNFSPHNSFRRLELSQASHRNLHPLPVMAASWLPTAASNSSAEILPSRLAVSRASRGLISAPALHSRRARFLVLVIAEAGLGDARLL